MIPRYDKKEISEIWQDQNKFETYLQVELAVLQAIENAGRIPKGTSDKIKARAKINPSRIDDIEKEVKHDVIAFCTSITENLDPNIAKYFHFGVTSSDIIDSSLTIQVKQSMEHILDAFKELLDVLRTRAEEMKDVMTMGRSHGMFAEPMSFGGKILGHYAEFNRRYEEYREFYDNELTVKFSGAVGNYTILTPEIEKDTARILGLNVEPISTQVIPRDRLAKLVSIGALTASAIERLSVEIRHLHRSEVAELHEGFSKDQKGSSTMPHKKNPISAENLSGMARVLRSHMMIASENIVLWHERDISHSSTERIYLPDHFGLLFYSLKRISSTVESLVFHNENIEKTVTESAGYLSSYYLHKLIESTDRRREDLYRWVQDAAFAAEESGDVADFEKSLSEKLREEKVNLKLPKLSKSEIKNIYLGKVDTIFKRVLNKKS